MAAERALANAGALDDGDPLADVGATLSVVGVVRNGRFYSAISLIERAHGEQIVE